MSYYQILGVPETASQEEIKRAYRKQALQQHPDKGGDAELFQKLSTAYDILSNPSKRALYNRFGEAGLQGVGGPRQQIVISQEITLIQAFSEGPIPVQLKRQIICNHCVGTGFQDGVQRNCGGCRGRGVMPSGPGGMVQMLCPLCHGSKPYTPSDCPDCNDGQVMEELHLKAAPPTSLLEPRALIEDVDGVDLVVDYRIQGDDQWQVCEGHLVYNWKIKLGDAISGAKHVIEHPDGRIFSLRTGQGLVPSVEQLYVLPENSLAGYPMYIKVQIEHPSHVELPERKVVVNYHTLRKILGTDRNTDEVEENVDETIRLETLQRQNWEQILHGSEQAGSESCRVM